MASFYQKMQNTASKLLGKFAQGDVVLVKAGTQTNGANEWDLPTISNPTEYQLNATVKGVDEKFINGTSILATDLQIMAAVFDVAPSIGDRVLIDGNSYTVLRVASIPSAGTACAWQLIVR